MSINIFSKDYPKRDMPINTKKLFYDNRCYFDTVKHDDLLNDMHICWKEKEETILSTGSHVFGQKVTYKQVNVKVNINR